METITVQIFKDDVYEEVAKATDYTGAKLIDGDEGARDRILATDSDLSDLGRFWEESVLATNERLKEMLVSGATKQIPVTITQQPKEVEAQSIVIPSQVTRTGYEAVLEVSKSFDKGLKTMYSRPFATSSLPQSSPSGSSWPTRAKPLTTSTKPEK